MSILDHAPNFSPEEVIQFAKHIFDLNCTAKPLPSERDQNFLLQTETGKCFVLKIANGNEDRAMLEAQNQVMGHLANTISFCPRVLLTNRGEEITQVP